jgi:uncharacterized membrane protein YjjB (DUF3815 family)
MICYAVASFSATIFFFGGTIYDGLCGILWGLLVYAFDNQSYRLKGLSEVSSFAAAFLVSLLGAFFDRFFFSGGMCLYAQLLGGIVWMLPGVSITASLLEMYARMGVYGSSKLMMAIFTATQLGFGLQLGYRTVFQTNKIPDSFVDGCHNSVDVLWGFLLIPIAVIAMGVILQAHYSQFIGKFIY